MLKLKKTPALPVPVALDAELLAAIDAVAARVKDTRSAVMRKAIREGLRLLTKRGEVVRLGRQLGAFVDELAAQYNRCEEYILEEAVRRGIRAVELDCMIEQGRAKGINEGSLQAIKRSHDSDAYPEKREVRQALLEKGALQIQLDDLLQHCQEARERKDAVEQHTELLSKRYGSGPSMWGSGVDTETLKRQIAKLAAELKAAPAIESDVPGSAAPGRVTAAKPAPAKPPKRKPAKP